MPRMKQEYTSVVERCMLDNQKVWGSILSQGSNIFLFLYEFTRVFTER